MANTARNIGIVVIILIIIGVGYTLLHNSSTASNSTVSTTTVNSSVSSSTTSLESTTSVNQTSTGTVIVASPQTSWMYIGGPQTYVIVGTNWPNITYTNAKALNSEGISERISHSVYAADQYGTFGWLILYNASSAAKNGTYTAVIAAGPSANLTYANVTFTLKKGSASTPFISIAPRSVNLTAGQSANVTFKTPLGEQAVQVYNITSLVAGGVALRGGETTYADGINSTVLTLSANSLTTPGKYILSVGVINVTTLAVNVTSATIDIK